MNETDRRRFLKAAAASVAAAGLGTEVIAQQQESPQGIPTRPFGKTGEHVSIVGLGGAHIGSVEEQEAIKIMHEAIDQGMTFFDNSWDYHDGRSEEVVGKALRGGPWRQKTFLMTKVCARDYEGARKQLEDSLRRLRTETIDLWQFHEINWDVDPDWVFDKGGLKFALEAKKAGKVRYIGFTGHKHFAHQLKMLSKPYEWDSVQMPISIVDAHFCSFQKNVLPECTRRNIAAIGMKSLSNGIIPSKLPISAEVCRRFALTLPISVLVCGIRSQKDLRQDLAMARNFRPVTEKDIDELLAQTAEPARDGALEPHKIRRYGTEYHHRQHGD